MKAVRFHDKGDIRVEDVAAPQGRLGDTDVLIRPILCGICGTDLHEYVAGPIVTPSEPHLYTGAKLPQILGHEFSAEVLDIGSAVDNVKRGDRVSIQPLVSPRDDYYGRRGLYHLSEKMGCIGLSWNWGGMGERAVVNSYNVFAVPDGVSDVQAAMIEPAAVALYAVDRGGVQAGSTVLVSGVGPIGALALLACRAAGASKIIVAEPNPQPAGAREPPRARRRGGRSARGGPCGLRQGSHRGRRRGRRGARMRRARSLAQRLRQGGAAARHGRAGRPSHASRVDRRNALGAEGHHSRSHLVLPHHDLAPDRRHDRGGAVSRREDRDLHDSSPRTWSRRASTSCSIRRAAT